MDDVLFSWLHLSDIHAGHGDRGKLRVGKQQLENVVLYKSPNELVIVMTHHPFTEGWLKDENDAAAWIQNRAHAHLSATCTPEHDVGYGRVPEVWRARCQEARLKGGTYETPTSAGASVRFHNHLHQFARPRRNGECYTRRGDTMRIATFGANQRRPVASRGRVGGAMISAFGFVVLATLVACDDEYPPCTPGDGAGAGGPETQVTIGVGPTSGSGDWGAADEGHGYTLGSDGKVCVCDARDAEILGCVPEPPEELPVCGSPADMGNGCLSNGNAPKPDSWGICGNVYWCCYSLRCENGAKHDQPATMLCPKSYGEDNTRNAAWEIWNKRYIKGHLKELQAENGVCWKREASCYDEPPPKGVCGNFPN